MSVYTQLPLDKLLISGESLAQLQLHEYPQQLKVVKSPDEVDYLKLVEWNPG